MSTQAQTTPRQTEEHLSSVVSQQRARLMQMLYEPMHGIALQCEKLAAAPTDRAALDAFLSEAFASVPHAKYLYMTDTRGVQISSSVSREGLLPAHFGRDRSDRPYMREALAAAEVRDNNREYRYQQWPYLEDGTSAIDFVLCEAYISQHALRPSLTAIHFLRTSEGGLVGFLGADFALRDLPPMPDMYAELRRSRHFLASPDSNLGHLTSRLDREMDTVISVLEELISFHGVFHVKLHFSSSQAVIWQVDDPYCYRLLSIGDLLDPDICLAYPRHDFPRKVQVDHSTIRRILERWKDLRQDAGITYLRSASLNIVNGMVGLSFSSDGSHYIPQEEFLQSESMTLPSRS